MRKTPTNILNISGLRKKLTDPGTCPSVPDQSTLIVSPSRHIVIFRRIGPVPSPSSSAKSSKSKRFPSGRYWRMSSMSAERVLFRIASQASR